MTENETLHYHVCFDHSRVTKITNDYDVTEQFLRYSPPIFSLEAAKERIRKRTVDEVADFLINFGDEYTMTVDHHPHGTWLHTSLNFDGYSSYDDEIKSGRSWQVCNGPCPVNIEASEDREKERRKISV